MSVVLKNNADGSLGLQGADLDVGPFMTGETELTSATVDKRFFIAPRRMVVQQIDYTPDVAGTDAGAVTAVVRKVPSGTAIGSGTQLTAGSFNLKGTVNTRQSTDPAVATTTLSTTPSDLVLAKGDALAVDVTGTLTAVAGVFTVGLTPA
jgi:hypothetical protein